MHATIEQIYRIVKRINNDIEASRLYGGLPRCIQQVWHEEIFYKIKNSFSTDKSTLNKRLQDAPMRLDSVIL
jgi:hypothetical protein